MTIGRLPATMVQKFCMKIIESKIAKIKDGYLIITYPDGSVKHFGDRHSKDRAEITINGYSFFSKVLFNGEIGFGESFVEHGWDSPDPARLILFFIRHLNLEEDNHVVLKALWLLLNRL
jgi:cyclopropane-fatty-acyl-phospholipid synthase